MTIKVTQVPQNNSTGENTDPLGYEATFDGQTYFFAPGQVRSFADDRVGVGVAGNSGAGAPATGIVEDNVSSKKKNPNDQSRS